MRPRTASEAFADVTIRLEEQNNEDLRPATYRETAAAIFMALAESELENDPSDEGWNCEIELLEDDYDMDAQVPDVAIPTKH